MRLEVAKKKLFEGFEIECYEDISRDNGDFFMTVEQISQALEIKRNTLDKNISRNKDIVGEPHKNNYILDITSRRLSLYDVNQILKIASFTAQVNSQILINELSKITGYSPLKIKSRYEIDFEKIFLKTFKDIIYIEKQYSINKYFVDWYVPEYNIIIECDENNHCGYYYEKDLMRTNFINKKLNNPIWIRFNPNEENFNIGTVINMILLQINMRKICENNEVC